MPKSENRSEMNGGTATTIAEPKVTSVAPERPIVVEPSRSAPPVVHKPSKQDLLDDLQRSYKEVVTLVERVNEHLDKTSERSVQLEQLARQALDATATLPEAIAAAVERANPAQIEILRELVRAQEDGTQRVETSVAQLGVQMEVASQSHEQLVGTMADFRDTMQGVSTSNMRTADALDSSIAQKRAADDRLAQMIVRNQWWMIGIVGGIMVFAASAFIVAIVALLKMGS